jgi:hypothetical protein
VDHYEEAVVELIRRKRAGLPAEPQKVSPTALRRSLADEGQKRIAGQTEMLLPIAGKMEKEVAKPGARAASRKKAS